jgi:hypothetical protein
MANDRECIDYACECIRLAGLTDGKLANFSRPVRATAVILAIASMSRWRASRTDLVAVPMKVDDGWVLPGGNSGNRIAELAD